MNEFHTEQQLKNYIQSGGHAHSFAGEFWKTEDGKYAMSLLIEQGYGENFDTIDEMMDYFRDGVVNAEYRFKAGGEYEKYFLASPKNWVRVVSKHERGYPFLPVTNRLLGEKDE